MDQNQSPTQTQAPPEPRPPVDSVRVTGCARSTQISQIALALAKAQQTMPIARKNATVKIFSKRTNKEFSFDYADLACVVETSRPHLTANELAVSQFVEVQDGVVEITTLLMHSSGQWLQSRIRMRSADSADPKEIGIVITYARRYAYASMVGVAVADEDQDAGAAGDGPGLNQNQLQAGDTPPPPREKKGKQYKQIKTSEPVPTGGSTQQPPQPPAQDAPQPCQEARAAWAAAQKCWGPKAQDEIKEILGERSLKSLQPEEAAEVLKCVYKRFEEQELAKVGPGGPFG